MTKIRESEEMKDKKGIWLEYVREVIPLHTASTIAMGVVNESGKMIGSPFTRILVANDAQRTWWCNWEKDIHVIGEFLISWLKDGKNRRSHFKKHKECFINIINHAEKIIRSGLGGLKDSELSQEYAGFHKETMIYHGLSFDIDAIDIVLEKKIKDKLSVLMEKNRKGFTPKDFNNALGVILTPNYTSYMTEFDIELYGVCSFIKKNGAEDSFETKKEVREKIKALLSRFWWIELTWSQRNRKTFEGVVSEIKEIIKKGEDIDREAIRLKNSAEEAETRKKILGKDLKFDDEMDTYIDIFENYAVFHDYRKEAQMKTTEALNIILGEIGKRKGHDPGDLAWCWPDEIKKVFEGEGIDKNKADERRKSFFMLVEKKGIEQHTGKKAAERRGEELLSAFEGITNFTGTIASPGKEIGKAKVCFSSQDAIKKIGKGDILVASMTLPDYVPAMKKAAAIVTDEGGVTCHAAIVSRELKIPCIIGTGIATKVLKDGDYIEVNANHGVVRILEKAKSGGQE